MDFNELNSYYSPMSQPLTLIHLVLSILTLLAFATIASFVLKKSKPQNETLAKVWVIVRSWWYIAIPFLGALYWGALPLMLLFFVVSCFAMLELIKHSRFATLRRPLFLVVVLVTLVQYSLLFYKVTGFFYVFIPLSLVWVIPLLLIVKPEVAELPRIGSLAIGALLFTYYLSYVPALPWLAGHVWPSHETPYIALLLLVFLTQANDVLQFIFGKCFGRNKIVPAISPNKTEAGFMGGVLCTTLLSTWLASPLLEIKYSEGAILGILVSCTGIFGDLLFSAVKRYYGTKDFSALIPGHGGLLDRIDSLILTSPIFFHYLMYLKGHVQ